MNARSIYLSPYDHQRLSALVAEPGDLPALRNLRSELERAVVVPGHARMPTSIVALDSRIALEDRKTGAIREVTLVLPGGDTGQSAAVSVVEPLGTALLGRSAGDVVSLDDGRPDQQFRIVRVVHSPLAEAAAALSVQ